MTLWGLACWPLGRSMARATGGRAMRVLWAAAFMAAVAPSAQAAAFVDSFDTDSGMVTSFTRVLGGVTFVYTFTLQGDGGLAQWDSTVGNNGSEAIYMSSNNYATATTEFFTIARQDGKSFTFKRLYVDNTVGGEEVTVGAYKAGVLVGGGKRWPRTIRAC